MIVKLAQCSRCMDVIYLAEEVGLRWTADLTPLDAQTATQALVGGRQVYRVTQPGPRLSTAKPDVLKALREAPMGDRPIVVASHSCPEGSARPLGAAQGGGEGLAPKEAGRPPVPPSRPSSGPSTASSTPVPAQSAETPASNPTCSGCGQPCADGTYASIALGDLIQWAHHVDACN